MVAIITIICKLRNSRARMLFLALWICELLSVSAQQGLLSTKTSSWSVRVHPAGNSYHFVGIYCPSQHRIMLLSALLWVSLQGVSMCVCVLTRAHLPVSVPVCLCQPPCSVQAGVYAYGVHLLQPHRSQENAPTH